MPRWVGWAEQSTAEQSGRGGGGGSARGRRTSSDFSAVAAASERAALLCTSSLMASPVQPWLGSVLYHTAGRVLPIPPSPSALAALASLPPSRAPLNPLSFSSSLYLGPSPLPLVASGVKGNAPPLRRGFETLAFVRHNVVPARVPKNVGGGGSFFSTAARAL